MMKKALMRYGMNGVLAVGMAYAIASVMTVPVRAASLEGCTAQDCATVAETVGLLCQTLGASYGCNDGGEVLGCDQDGFQIYCYGCDRQFGSGCED